MIMTQSQLIKALKADLKKYGIRQVEFSCEDDFYNGPIKHIVSNKNNCLLLTDYIWEN